MWFDICSALVSSVLIVTSLINSYRIKNHLVFIEGIITAEQKARRAWEKERRESEGQ